MKIKYHTKEEALAAVIQDGNELEFCAPELKNNEDVVMAAVKQGAWFFEYASDKLKSNKTFIMKAINEVVDPLWLIAHASIIIQSDIEVLTLALKNSSDGIEFVYAKGDAVLNKELAAKALVKWGNSRGHENFNLWENLEPPLKEFFPKDSFYKKAQAYLVQLGQEKQAELISGDSTAEDGVVW